VRAGPHDIRRPRPVVVVGGLQQLVEALESTCAARRSTQAPSPAGPPGQLHVRAYPVCGRLEYAKRSPCSVAGAELVELDAVLAVGVDREVVMLLQAHS
jgi:hypothetical protein